MAYRRTYPRFTVIVEAGFLEDGAWAIDARLQYTDGTTPPLGSHLLGEEHRAMLAGILNEAFRGRELGAIRMKVTMDVGDCPVDLPPEFAGPLG